MPGSGDPGSANRRAGSLTKSFFLTIVALLTLGCTQPQSADSQPPAARIIVKFTDTARAAPDAFQVRVPGDATFILRHERAMSGGAHLYNGRMSEQQQALIVQALNQRAGVEYAEADRALNY